MLADGGEAHGMVPHRLLRRREEGEAMCAYCAALFAFFAEEQYPEGRPWRGRNALVRVTGWSRKTVTEHVQHLSAAGLLTVEQEGQRMAVYRVPDPRALRYGARLGAEDGAEDGAAPVEGTESTGGAAPVEGTGSTGHPPQVATTGSAPGADSGGDAFHTPRSLRSECPEAREREGSRGGAREGSEATATGEARCSICGGLEVFDDARPGEVCSCPF